MDSFQQKAAFLALKNMFENDRYFSICTVDKVLKMTNTTPDRNDYQALNTLHCVDWSMMGADMKREVMEKVLNMIGGEDVKFMEWSRFVDTVDPSGDKKTSAGWGRLLPFRQND